MSDSTRTPRDDVRHFHVHTCLGSGGFGDVYRATMISSGGVRHEVAVKVLHDGLDPSSQAVQRLRDEGRMLGVLRHPAILRVHDLVVLAGRVALVTEFVDGGDLDQCFKAGDLELRPLVEICGQVAAALDTAWNHPSPDGAGELHLVHRDVKPANIRIGKHGEVKLLDFGIAKAAGVQREAKTQARAVIGSYLYMAPERLVRKDGLVPAGDVYSIGAVLYEGLARRRLFAGVDLKDQLMLARDPEGHDKYVTEAVTALHAVDPRVRELALSCLHHDPRKRPSSHELANACEELADALPGSNLRQWSRKRQWAGVAEKLGELGGRTLTESTIITDTLPADALATPQPVPRKQATMVSWLDSEKPEADSLPTDKVSRSKSSATIVAFDEDSAHTSERPPPPTPQALPVDNTAIRHSGGSPSVPTTSSRKRGSEAPTQLTPPPPTRRAPAPAPSAAPPAPARSGPGLGMLALAVVVLGLGAIAVATMGGLGAVYVLKQTEGGAATDAVDVLPTGPAPAPEPEQPAPAPAPTSGPKPTPAVPAPTAAPTPAPTAAPAPAPTAAPEPEVHEIEIPPAPVPEPEVAPAPGPTTVIITKDPEPGSGDAWGDGAPEPVPEPEPVQPRGGTVSVEGRFPVQLRGRGQTHSPGQVPVGAWEIWADFGDGYTRASNAMIVVGDGGSYIVKCSSLRLQCTSSEG